MPDSRHMKDQAVAPTMQDVLRLAILNSILYNRYYELAY